MNYYRFIEFGLVVAGDWLAVFSFSITAMTFSSSSVTLAPSGGDLEICQLTLDLFPDLFLSVLKHAKIGVARFADL